MSGRTPLPSKLMSTPVDLEPTPDGPRRLEGVRPPRVLETLPVLGNVWTHERRVALVRCVTTGRPAAFELVGGRAGVSAFYVGGSAFLSRARDVLDADACRTRDVVDPLVRLMRPVVRLGRSWAFLDVHLGAPTWLPVCDAKGQGGLRATPLVGALASLPQGCTGVYQTLLSRTSRCSWASLFLNGLPIAERGRPWVSRPRKAKLAPPTVFFGAALRIAAFGFKDDAQRAVVMARLYAGVQSAFGATTSHSALSGAAYTTRYGRKASAASVARYALLYRVAFRTGPVYSAHESACLFGFPERLAQLGSAISWSQRPFSAPPEAAFRGESGELRLGTNADGPVQMDVGWRASASARPSLILGRSGGGKSTLAAWIAEQIIASGAGLFLLDPNRDLCDDVIARIPPERLDDVLLLDASAWATHPFQLNLFHVPPGQSARAVAEDVVDFFRAAVSYVGSQMEELILHLAIALVLDTKPHGPDDGYRLLADEAFRDALVARLVDAREQRWWRTIFPSVPRTSVQAVRKAFSQFELLEPLRAIFGQGRQSVDFGVAMAKRRIILCALPRGRIGPVSCSVLGSVLVSQALRAAMGRERLAREDREPFRILVDEAHHFNTRAFATLLSEARKYAVSVTLATQHLTKLTDEVRSSILGNAGTTFCFRPSREDVRVLLGDFEGVTPADFSALSVGRMLVRVGGIAKPFAVDVPAPPPPQRVDADLLARLHARAGGAAPKLPPERPLPEPGSAREQAFEFVL